ncbi:MAG TPA: ABC transporter permease, partial [Thermomicrobiales bacterium]|nr:ABC transporter permease [Thermomicrobiales bacterium]
MATTVASPELRNYERRVHGTGFTGTILGFFRRLARNKGALVAGIVLLCLVLISINAIGSRLAPYDPTKMAAGPQLAPPSAANWFGTDQFGRDILSRVIYGGRLTLGTSLFGVVLAAIVGTTAGLAAGYLAGWIDFAIMRMVDVMLAFPGLLLTLAIVAVLGPGQQNIQIALGVSLIPGFVRLVRGAVLATKSNDYIEAAATIGCHPLRVMFRHILPNIMTPIVVLFTT